MNFPGTSDSAVADVTINVFKNVIALWKAGSQVLHQLKIKVNDAEYQVIGKFITKKLKTSHSLIKSYRSRNFVAIKKRTMTVQSQILAVLIIHANDIMHAYKKM